METVKLLDCTLRDGGHVTNGKFGKHIIKAIIEDLVQSNVDIIEAGFLWDTETDEDTARYHSISELKKYLPKDMGRSKIALMADNVDLSELEPYDGTVEYIRLSFRKTELQWAIDSAEQLIQKGYKVYINPIHGSNITDNEYLDIIRHVNLLKPYGFSIVDTFGAMRQKDLGRIYYLIEHNLNKDIAIGVHLHENLGLAYSLAQYFLGIASPNRKLSIDGSMFGMGKIPGNLCIEQIMDFLNNEYNCGYSLEPVYDAIDEFIMPIYQRTRWGYSIPYAISGQCGIHRTYAEYLANKDRLRTKDIRRILSAVDESHKEIFDEKHIESLYLKYMDEYFEDSKFVASFGKNLGMYKNIVIIAPGASINSYDFDTYLLKNACIITVNFYYDKVEPTFCFFTNPKRLVGTSEVDPEKIMITSNLTGDVPGAKYIFSRNELVYHDGIFSDDSTLMLLSLLRRYNIKTIYIAGFDGFQKNAVNFYDTSFERKIRNDDYETGIRKRIISEVYSDMHISFLTRSIYES
jgi:4-hydroxy 2-oxovalerate aldolase